MSPSLDDPAFAKIARTLTCVKGSISSSIRRSIVPSARTLGTSGAICASSRP